MAIRGPWPSRRPELTTLLFDLDGTLVLMERRRRLAEARFVGRVTRRFAGAAAPWRLKEAVKEAVERQQSHLSDRTNFEVFLDALAPYTRLTRPDLEARVRAALTEDFAVLRGLFRGAAGAREALLEARALGYRLVLATNPMFPRACVELRLAWGGLADIGFAHITHSENMTRCKPAPAYYEELLEQLGVGPERCIMVGNDARKDLPAHEVGIPTYFVDHPTSRDEIERAQGDARLDGWGSFADLTAWLGTAREGG